MLVVKILTCIPIISVRSAILGVLEDEDPSGDEFSQGAGL
jgi:hypothetical protein